MPSFDAGHPIGGAREERRAAGTRRWADSASPTPSAVHRDENTGLMSNGVILSPVFEGLCLAVLIQTDQKLAHHIHQ